MREQFPGWLWKINTLDSTKKIIELRGKKRLRLLLEKLLNLLLKFFQFKIVCKQEKTVDSNNLLQAARDVR
jgi:hypothetical protein